MTAQNSVGISGPTYDLTKITARLQDRGVRHVMVIDDSLKDGPDQWKDLLPGVQDQIRTFIQDNPELEEWLIQENLTPPDNAGSPEAEEYLENLKPRVSERDDLYTVWEGYIEPSIGSARQEVVDLIQCLKDVGIEVQTSSADDLQAPPQDLSVIFIDYTLDDTDRQNLDAKSIAEINRIHAAMEPHSNPIVILMSSRTTLNSGLKETFREKTGIMPGMFFGFQKEQLKGINLFVILNDIAENWPKAVALQSFIRAISEASQFATDAVSSMINGFTLEDFAFIQLLSLNSDGHPLGEYLLWIIGGYFRQQLAENVGVKDNQESVDKMVFPAPPMTGWGPSDAFLSAYRATVFANSHPDITYQRYPTLDDNAKKLSGDLERVVALHFGDIFVEAGNGAPTAHIVMTPECDLAFGGSRAFPQKNSVVLVPGSMIPERPVKISSQVGARTEFLCWEGKDWRIEWKVKEAETVRLDEFKEMAKKRGLTRVARLEVSFAADIQRVYVGNLNRIGLPVVPPLFETQDATVYVENGDEVLRAVCGPVQDGAYLFSSPQFGELKCILSDQLVVELHKNLGEAVRFAGELPTSEELEKTPADKREQRQRNAENRAKRNTRNLNAFRDSLEAILAIKGPHNLDNSTGEAYMANVTITNKAQIEGSKARTVQKQVLTIQIQGPEDPESTIDLGESG